jgi:hypothetical protein
VARQLQQKEAEENNMAEFTVKILNRREGEGVLSVVIPEEAAPMILGDGGEQERDYGNAEWPSDADVSGEASKILGRAVAVQFFDRGDTLLEGIYKIIG